jgi:tetratricopeptide (TPR) repeat protein
VNYRYHHERSNPTECLEFIDGTLLVCRSSSKDMEDVLAEIHGTRGILAMEINQPEEALQHLEAHMVLRKKTFNGTGILTAKLAAGYSELAKALMMNGLFKHAEEMLAKSAEIRQKLEGFTRLQLFNTLRGQAWIESQRGDHEKAIGLVSQALRDREMAFGRDDREGGR